MWPCPLLLGSAGYRLLVYSHFHLYSIIYFGSTPYIYYVPFRQKSFLHHVKLEFSLSANTDKRGSSSYSGKLFCCRCMSFICDFMVFVQTRNVTLKHVFVKVRIAQNCSCNDLLSLASLSEKGCEYLLLRNSSFK